MKGIKRIVCALLAIMCVCALCSCGEKKEYPLYEDFTFVKEEYASGFGTGMHVEVKKVSGCAYRSVNTFYRVKNDPAAVDKIRQYVVDRIRNYIVSKGLKPDNEPLTQEEIDKMLETAKLYTGELSSMQFEYTKDKQIAKTNTFQLQLSVEYGNEGVEFKSDDEEFSEIVDCFELYEIMLFYKYNGESRVMFYYVDTGEYSIV